MPLDEVQFAVEVQVFAIQTRDVLLIIETLALLFLLDKALPEPLLLLINLVLNKAGVHGRLFAGRSEGGRVVS